MRNLIVESFKHVITLKENIQNNCRITIDELAGVLYVLDGSSIIGVSSHKIQDNVLEAASLGIKVTLNQSFAQSIIGIDFLADQQLLCVALTDGRIYSFETFSKQVACVSELEEELVAVAWSPDLELAAIVTAGNTLVLLNRNFDKLFQTNATPDSFGQDELITVGWGKKETQFHGSEGKQAAKGQMKDQGKLAPMDDLAVHISWAGDGQYFAVSSLCHGVRQIRVWSRDGAHCSTTEPLDGLESCLSWRPSGNLIASAQKKNNEYLVIFFERNGLRHGGFALTQPPATVLIKKLAWNVDSTVLLVMLEEIDAEQKTGKDSIILEFWTVRNYHWYKKLSFTFAPDGLGSLSDCRWDGEEALKLHLVTKTGNCFQTQLSWDFTRSPCDHPGDPAMCAVIDGASVLMTPFRYVVIPPPMSLHSLGMDASVNQVVFQQGTPGHNFMCVQANGKLAGYTYLLDTEMAGADYKKSPRQLFSADVPSSSKTFQNHFVWLKNDRIVFVENEDCCRLVTAAVEVSDGATDLKRRGEVLLELPVRDLIVISETCVSVVFVDGTAATVDIDTADMSPCDLLTHGAGRIEVISVAPGETVAVLLNEKFQLFFDSKQITDNAGSFCCNDQFLLVCTLKHRLYCIPLDKLKESTSLHQWETSSRTVERGSELVIAVAADTKVVLQLPRGNLEIIHPRPLVLNALKRMLRELRYKEAIVMMKKHRINMNLLYDFDPKLFLQNVDVFVRDVNNVDLFNIFLAEISNDDVTKKLYSGSFGQEHHNSKLDNAVSDSETALAQDDNYKVNRLCNTLRNVFDSAGSAGQYLTCVTLTFVRSQPSDTESALQRIQSYRDEQLPGGDFSVVDAALMHLLCLTDIDRLFDCALGTYDFELVLMVAQKSQKDPKEYLPFLNDLKGLENNYMKYRIDCHLKRHAKALTHIAKCGPEHFEECVQLIEKQELYTDGLKLYDQSSEEYKNISLNYAKFLMSRRRPCEAGLIFDAMMAYPNAIMAFTQASEWQLALSVAVRGGMPDEDVLSLAGTLADKLKSQAKFSMAAQVYTDWCQDETSAIDALLEGHHWQDAHLLIMKSKKTNLIVDKLVPEILSSSTSTIDLLHQKQALFVKHRDRLRSVRQIKQTRYNDWKLAGGTADDLEACETYSEVSTISRVSTKSAGFKNTSASLNERQRRRAARKKVSLKVGSPYEDLALLQEITEIVKYMDQSKDSVRSLTVALRNHDKRSEATSLQETLDNFQNLVVKSMSEIYPEQVQIHVLPGPMHDYITNDSDAEILQTGGLPSGIKLDPLLVPPKLTDSSYWKLA